MINCYILQTSTCTRNNAMFKNAWKHGYKNAGHKILCPYEDMVLFLKYLIGVYTFRYQRRGIISYAPHPRII